MIKLNLKKFFKKVVLKKKYIKLLENFSIYKLKTTNFYSNNNMINYVIQVNFLKSNTLIQITNFDGNLKFQYSAGNVYYKGKTKKMRILILNVLIKKIIQKFQFLKHKHIALHLKNVKFLKFWILKKLKKKVFIKIIKNFNNFCYNGCRNKKIRTKIKRNG